MSEDRPGVVIDDGIRAFPPRPDRVMMMMLEDQGAYGQQDLFLAVLPATEADEDIVWSHLPIVLRHFRELARSGSPVLPGTIATFGDGQRPFHTLVGGIGWLRLDEVGQGWRMRKNAPPREAEGALVGVLLTDEERDLATHQGLKRVVNRLTDMHGFYPFPWYSRWDRQSVAPDHRGPSDVPWMRIPTVSMLRHDNTLILQLEAGSGSTFANLIAQMEAVSPSDDYPLARLIGTPHRLGDMHVTHWPNGELGVLKCMDSSRFLTAETLLLGTTDDPAQRGTLSGHATVMHNDGFASIHDFRSWCVLKKALCNETPLILPASAEDTLTLEVHVIAPRAAPRPRWHITFGERWSNEACDISHLTLFLSEFEDVLRYQASELGLRLTLEPGLPARIQYRGAIPQWLLARLDAIETPPVTRAFSVTMERGLTEDMDPDDAPTAPH